MNKTQILQTVLRSLNAASPPSLRPRPYDCDGRSSDRIRTGGTSSHTSLRTDEDANLADVSQFLAFAAPLAPRASAEFFQDLWALWEAGGKRDGFFVEFGAADGKSKSNTFFLEMEMNWKGVVAEPHPAFMNLVRRHRSCVVSDKCVYSRSGERIEFLATQVGELGRIAFIDPQDDHKREDHTVVEVETISLNDLLIEAQAPQDIDFLSIDTEGSEFEILAHFDFDRWNLRTITVEHNRTKMRERIFNLLTSRGYRRKWPEMSYCDDWYVQ